MTGAPEFGQLRVEGCVPGGQRVVNLSRQLRYDVRNDATRRSLILVGRAW